MSIKCPAPVSPDLTSLNTFVWVYVKNFVSLAQNNGRQQMKARINVAVATVTALCSKLLKKVEYFVDVPPGVTTLKLVGLKSLKVFLCNDAYRTSLSEHMAKYKFFGIITVLASCMKNVQCSDSATIAPIKNS
jgi:hypothetical protein